MMRKVLSITTLATGLLLFSMLLYKLLLNSQKFYRQFKHDFYRRISLATAVFVCMIATINTMSNMIETDKTGGLFWLNIGRRMVLGEKLKEKRESLASS